MVRQTSKKVNQTVQQSEDSLFMLSCIRSRENALIFFLQLFVMTTSQKLNADQYNIYKQEFLQKQKINSLNIKSILDKTSNQHITNTQVKSFWIKLKSIIRVSLERARTLGMLTTSLELSYTQILHLADQFYNQASPLRQYSQIQQLVKKRTIQALIATKHLLLDHPSQDFGKIRSQTFLKGQLKHSEGLSLSPGHNHSQKDKQMPSLQEVEAIKEHRLSRKQKVKIKGCDFKKMHYSICRFETKLADVMNMKFDYHFDKKKPQIENENTLYDTLFARNINNHKMITKYTANCGKLVQKIATIKRSTVTQRRHLSHSKLQKRGIDTSEPNQLKLPEGKGKLVRPKTSKQSKKAQMKGQNAKTEKLYELLKAF